MFIFPAIGQENLAPLLVEEPKKSLLRHPFCSFAVQGLTPPHADSETDITDCWCVQVCKDRGGEGVLFAVPCDGVCSGEQ